MFFRFLSFLFSLFSVSLSFSAVALSGSFRFRSRDQFISFLLFAELSIFTSGSPCVASALVLPSCGFCLRVIFLRTWSTPSSVPAPVFASRLVRLCFVVRCCTIVAIRYAFFFSFFGVSPFSAFLREFPRPFATSSVYPLFVCQTVCRYIRLLFASFALASGLRGFTCDSFEFLVGFSVLYRLPLRFFHLRVPMVFPCWYVHSFQLPLLRFMDFISFICFSPASAISSLLLFILPSSVPFPFPRLCAVLSHSLPVRSASLSFFHSGFLIHVLDLTPCFLVRSLHPRLLSFFDSVFLFCNFETFQFFALRLSSLLCGPFQSSTSTPLLRPPLGFTVLSLLLSSPEHLYSSSWFFLWLLWGLVSVRGLAVAPAVPVVLRLCFVLRGYSVLSSSVSAAPAPVILSPFSAYHLPVGPSSLPLRFSTGLCSGCSFLSSSLFLRMLRLQLLLPVFLCVSTGCGCTLPFVVRLLLPCLLRFSGCGSSPFLFFALPSASTLSSCPDFHRFLPFFIPLS